MLVSRFIEMIILAVFTASLSLAFNHFLKAGMIFNWYALLLLSFDAEDGSYWDNDKWNNQIFKLKHPFRYMLYYYFGSIVEYIRKPLGLCVFCNGTWIGIVIYAIFHSVLTPISISFWITVFLFIGINWLFIYSGKRFITE